MTPSTLISEVTALLASIKDLTRTHGMDVRIPIYAMADRAMDMLDALDLDLQAGGEDAAAERKPDHDPIPY